MVVRAENLRDDAFAQELARQVERSPRFFQNAPVVLDLRGAEGFADAEDFAAAQDALRDHTLVLIGVQNAEPAQLEAAIKAGFASFAPTAAQPTARRAARALAEGTAEAADPMPAPASAPRAAPALPPRATANLITQPVRSGTQVYAKGTDLVVTAAVSPGAELVADGNIHVYAALRGRAIAGAGGDATARIFCARLEAELVSIAGRYLVSEQMPQELRGLSVQIALVDDQLTITRN
jgi:septum site-determining protein MinC